MQLDRLRAAISGAGSMTVTDARDVFETLESTTTLLGTLFTIINVTAMFLCFFALSSSMYTSIYEQAKEIAILRAMGFNNTFELCAPPATALRFYQDQQLQAYLGLSCTPAWVMFDDLVQWFGFRSRDTHDLMHVLTGYGRDALGEQCVLLFTHGQQPSHGHLLIGYAGALNIKQNVRGSKAPVFKAVRQAQKTGTACPPLVEMSIRELLAMDLAEARAKLNIPEPHWYRECHRGWREEGIDPYDLLGTEKVEGGVPAAA